MRPIRTVIATLLVVSLASLAYAWMRGRDTARTPGESMKSYEASSAAQQEQSTEKEQQKKQKEQSKQEQKQQKHPAGKSARIPDDQFRAHFGRPHTFAVRQVIPTTTVIPNQTRFVYLGYTFIFVDPWPADWLLADDCYIDYIDDEYFLFDAFHPGIRVALIRFRSSAAMATAIA